MGATQKCTEFPDFVKLKVEFGLIHLLKGFFFELGLHFLGQLLEVEGLVEDRLGRGRRFPQFLLRIVEL